MNAERLLARFLRYVQIDTTARDTSFGYPSSPGQLELGRMLVKELREMGLSFTVRHPTGVDEVTGGLAPDVLVMRNAQHKARAVAHRYHDSLVIGADTEVVLDGVVFGKPADLSAAAMSASRTCRLPGLVE